jgi:tetratricopeptide (TPR) repeat protein
MVEHPWDFMAVYYSAIDEFGHFFMPYHPPYVNGVAERDAAIYRDVIVGCYRFHDMMLEALLAYAGRDTTIVLVSDHGFHSGARRPGANAWARPEHWHREFGIACIHGPAIRQHESLYGASLLDVTPTILAMFGLPIGNDMDGRAWLEIFNEPVRAQRIESWESVPGDAGLHADPLREDPYESAEIIRQLVDLGYIDPPGDDAEEAIRNVRRDHKINLAVALAASRRVAGAVPLWEQLVEECPDEVGFLLQLASCYLRLGRIAECKATLDRSGDEHSQSHYVQLIRSAIALQEGNTEESLRRVRDVHRQSPSDAAILNRIGEVFLQAKAWDEAESVFRRSLDLQEDNPTAHDGLAQVFLERDEFALAIEQALLAVGLIHYFPKAHHHLGLALHGAGREQEAIAAFETCLAMGFEPHATHCRLAQLYFSRNPEKAHRHREYAGLT